MLIKKKPLKISNLQGIHTYLKQIQMYAEPAYRYLKSSFSC